MVCLLPAADSARVPVIIITTFVIGLSGFARIVAGSLEALYNVMTGSASWLTFAGHYMVPTFIGNILGGVTLVAIIDHAQVVSGTDNDSGPDAKSGSVHQR